MKLQLSFEDIYHLVGTVAIIVGGIGAYLKFFQGRLYHPRLEVTMSGMVINEDGRTYLSTNIRLKNVGLSKVAITQKGSGLRVFASLPVPPMDDELNAYNVVWSLLNTFSTFASTSWVESGETVCDQHLIALRNNHVFALRLELHLRSNKHRWQETIVVINPRPTKKEPTLALPQPPEVPSTSKLMRFLLNALAVSQQKDSR